MTLRLRSRTAIILLLTAVAVGSGLTWRFVLRDRLIRKKFGVVVPGAIYRSGQISQFLIGGTLDQFHIKRVLCLTTIKPDDTDLQAELQAIKQRHLALTYCPMAGNGTGKPEHYLKSVECLAEAAKNHEPVLVHCHAGAQRTGGVVAAYRLLVESRSPEEVREELVSYGWNPRRDQILLDFINEQLPAAARRLYEGHYIAEIPRTLPRL